jgi:tetratricopeptide (TPR) repeat protein
LNYALFALNPSGWHLTSVLAHAAATVLVFRLVYRLFENRTGAALAALIFGLHPVHVQSVAWISGVTDPLLAIFLIGSFLQYLTFRETRKPRHLVGSLLLYTLAAFTKEPGIILPAIIFLHESFAQRKTIALRFTARLKIASVAVLPFLVVTIAYLAARMKALHGFAPALLDMDALTMLRTWPSILWLETKHLLLPWDYSLYYDLEPVRHFSTSQFLFPSACLSLLVAALAALCYLLRISREALFASLIWFTLPLIPSLYLPAVEPAIFGQDRYLYISSIGFAILVGNLILRGFALLDKGERAGTFTLYATVLIAVAFGSCTLIQQQYWRNNIALFRRAVSVAPNNEQALTNLGVALAEHEPADAVALFQRALDRDPDSAKLNYFYGYTLYRIGRYGAALRPLSRAAQLDSNMVDAFLYIGMAHLKLGYSQDAAIEITRAVKLEPLKRGVHLALGAVYEAQGDLPAALKETEIEARNYPDDPIVQQRLAALRNTAK